MRVLITAGPTHEPIDPVRYIGNRSSGLMGAALIGAAIRAGHSVTLILGPIALATSKVVQRIDVETSGQMHDAVRRNFPEHDLLIMAAAVADFRPKALHTDKVERAGTITLELEATADIVADAGRVKRADQRTIGFNLSARGDLARAQDKLHRKNLDLIVCNSFPTLGSQAIEAVLLWPNGRSESLSSRSKPQFADILLQRAAALFA